MAISNHINLKFIWLFPLPILFGASCIFLPWYLCILSFISFSLLLLLACKPAWWSYVIIFLIPLCSKVPGFDIASVGSSGVSKQAFTVTYILPILATLFLVLQKSVKRHAFKAKNPLYIPGLIFMCYCLFTFFWSPAEISMNLYFFLLLAANILIFYVLFQTIDGEDFHRRAMWCLFFSGILLSVQVFLLYFEIISTKDFSYQLFDGLSLDVIHENKIGSGTGIFLGGADTAMMLDVYIFVAMGFLLTVKSNAKKWVLRIAIVIFCFALFFTGKKSGTWSFFLMMLFFLFVSQKLRANFFRNLAIFFCLILVLVVITSMIKGSRGNKLPRVVNVNLEEGSSLGSRLQYWKEGFDQLEQSSLTVWGLGIGGYTDQNGLGISQPHNLYLNMFFDFGVPGILFICIAIVMMTKMFLNIAGRQKTYLQNMSVALTFGFCCVALNGLVATTYYSGILWLMLALLISTYCLAQKELAAEEESHIEKATNTEAA